MAWINDCDATRGRDLYRWLRQGPSEPVHMRSLQVNEEWLFGRAATSHLAGEAWWGLWGSDTSSPDDRRELCGTLPPPLPDGALAGAWGGAPPLGPAGTQPPRRRAWTAGDPQRLGCGRLCSVIPWPVSCAWLRIWDDGRPSSDAAKLCCPPRGGSNDLLDRRPIALLPIIYRSW